MRPLTKRRIPVLILSPLVNFVNGGTRSRFLEITFAGLGSRMKAALDRIDAGLAGLRTWAEEGKPLPFIDEGLDFAVGPPMEEEALQALEREYEVKLPPQYRAFLARFGDTSVGPCLQKAKEELTARSR